MQGARKIRMIVVGILALMSGFASFKDARNPVDMLGVMLWCTWAPLLLAVMLNKLSAVRSLYAYAVYGAFITTSLFSFGMLSFISIAVILGGPLNESGLIFIVFPYGFIKAGIIGALIAAVVWWLLTRRTNA